MDTRKGVESAVHLGPEPGSRQREGRGKLDPTSLPPPAPSPSGTTYPNTEVRELQALTHLQEVLHACLVQDDVHGDSALGGSIHDVLEDLTISEEVHDHSNDLDREGHQ